MIEVGAAMGIDDSATEASTFRLGFQRAKRMGESHNWRRAYGTSARTSVKTRMQGEGERGRIGNDEGSGSANFLMAEWVGQHRPWSWYTARRSETDSVEAGSNDGIMSMLEKSKGRRIRLRFLDTTQNRRSARRRGHGNTGATEVSEEWLGYSGTGTCHFFCCWLSLLGPRRMREPPTPMLVPRPHLSSHLRS